MNVRPCLYLRGIDSQTLKQFQELKDLGIPLVIEAQEIQRSSDRDQLMSDLSGENVHILSTDVDEKKHSLQSVIDACTQKGWTHLIVLDELTPELVTKFPEVLNRCLKNPWKLIVFNKIKKGDGIETNWLKRSLLGSYNYNHLMSPLCCYPLFFIQTIRFKKNRPFDYLQILSRLMWKKVEVEEIPLEQEWEPQSHNYKEKLYLAFYETVLTSIANIRQNTRPKNAAISCAVGAFIACTPFYGLQTVGIFVVCFLFGLNFPIAFLGSQVSLPPLYSLILPLELYVGFKVMGKPFVQTGDWLQMAQDHFSSWLMGAVVVGGAIAISLGITWYYLQRMIQIEEKVNWTGKMRGGRLGNFLIVSILKLLGQRTGYFLLYFIVPYFYIFAPKARRGLNEYWQVVKPELSYFKRQIRVIKQLMIFAQVLMDRAIQGHKEELYYDVDITRSINFREAAQSEQALLVLLSHLGGWGIALQGFGKKAYARPISIIEYENKNYSAEKVLQKNTVDKIKRIIVKPGEPLFMHLHELLNSGGNLGLMGDRPFDENFELLPFFGKLVAVPTTPFRLAKIYQCQLVMLLGLKTGFRSYALVAETLDTNKEVNELAQEYLRFLERSLQESPYQWFNFFNFWSSTPTLPNGRACYPKKYSLQLK